MKTLPGISDTVTFKFKNKNAAHAFLVWWLDCAGDQQYWECVREWREDDRDMGDEIRIPEDDVGPESVTSGKRKW